MSKNSENNNRNRIDKEIIKIHNSNMDTYFTKIYNNICDNPRYKKFYRPNSNKRLQIHKELYNIYENIKLKAIDISRRNIVIDRIEKLIEEVCPEYIIVNYGSFSYDLSILDSDLDFTLIPNTYYINNNKDNIKTNYDKDMFIGSHYNNKINKSSDIFDDTIDNYSDNQYQYKILHDIKSKIDKLLYKYNIDKINVLKVKVPLIRILFKDYTEISVDITAFQFSSIYAKYLIKNILRSNGLLFPLIIVIKYILKEKALNKMKYNGLSSYGIFHLAYYFLIHLKKNNIYGNNKLNINLNYLTLSDLFLGFLEFYGVYFDYKSFGISIRNGCRIIKNNSDNKDNSNCFIKTIIEDFIEPTKNVAEKCNFKLIVSLFKFCYLSLIYSPEDLKIIISRIICLDFLDEYIKNHKQIINMK